MNHNIILHLTAGKHKSYSTFMQWQVANHPFIIERRVQGSHVNALRRNQNINWTARAAGRWVTLPSNLHRHEVSIARWLVNHIGIKPDGFTVKEIA